MTHAWPSRRHHPISDDFKAEVTIFGKPHTPRDGRHRSKRRWHELDLLCQARVGLAPIAPAVCRMLREFVGADAVSIFWLDEQGMPAGFFHDSASGFVRADHERLFADLPAAKASRLAANDDRPVGQLVNIDARLKSKQHFNALDLTVDVADRSRAVVVLLREKRNPFDEDDAFYLKQALPYLRRAIEHQSDEGPWERSSVSGHMLVDRSGTTLLTVSDEASRLLKACTIVGQNVRIVGPEILPPRFAQELCHRLETSAVVQDTLDIPLGRLRLTATQMRTPVADTAEHVLISLEVERPKRLKIIESILELALSPLQRSIALVAATGGSRADCLTSTGVSNEALKKHLAVIYRVAAVNSWDELAKALH